MKIILFGASGMVGSAVLREALDAHEVESVLAIGRHSCGVEHPKLRELLLPDLFDFAAVEDQIAGYDACIWAIGVSSVGLDEAAYAQVTEALTLAWAQALLRRNPGLSFCYCSAAGAGGKAMWARVRQRVESALQSMPFQHAGIVRPAIIRPGPGIRSRTWGYRIGMVLLKPIFLFSPALVRTLPSMFTTSEILGRAMLRVVQGQTDPFVLESIDINRLGSQRSLQR
ncbi:NAD-dependent epimerase/dehydratase family protein [Azotobacter vinelandii]|uniref:NAD-dependent epimerase/dehydratase family protein n=1 Tax=Azotobacter vinelandii TaxID=354 RepID=UPI0026663311|nr:NAD-dependent epimerase/dehydratase family protein [Azotobacter vinelandii]WKN24350.1 NAD(P)H-binding protein [Azotobacter vinelandii]